MAWGLINIAAAAVWLGIFVTWAFTGHELNRGTIACALVLTVAWFVREALNSFRDSV